MALKDGIVASETRRKRVATVALVRPTDKRTNVKFFGHFGSPNHGNESTLLAILARLRSLYPQGEFRCICTDPNALLARHGIEGIPITTREARIWDREIPLGRRVPMALVGLGAELREYARVFKHLKGTDVLIIPGTGLVTDAFGIYHWGPYSQFKWVLMAKLRRSRVLFVSVGAGPIHRPTGRVLAKATLSLADYRSYRDNASRDYLNGIGFPAACDRVYPDLVFGLPDEMLAEDDARPDATRRVVGLGLMEYSGSYSAADPRQQTYTAYLEALATFATWLLEREYDIRLLLGDGGDSIVIDEFEAVLQDRLGSYDEGRIIEQPITSIEDLLAGLAASDVVVATRFHNVLMAMLLNKPVIAISFHHKCSSLMSDMNLSDYCHEIGDMDAERLIEQFETLEQNRDAVKCTIAVGVDEARIALDEQYDLLTQALD